MHSRRYYLKALRQEYEQAAGVEPGGGGAEVSW